MIRFIIGLILGWLLRPRDHILDTGEVKAFGLILLDIQKKMLALDNPNSNYIAQWDTVCDNIKGQTVSLLDISSLTLIEAYATQLIPSAGELASKLQRAQTRYKDDISTTVAMDVARARATSSEYSSVKFKFEETK